ncbi:polysaccharide biosynthesis protein [Aestuariivita boseongensis]|uniref:polysaccharide biosynthesis protein n=1 Tax=Aestuariivita boseongensis TaxID=1470562 RepID=UPI000ACD8D09|nr:polysaccharide biosynthesis protein [Aestuariivita boseongensis]
MIPVNLRGAADINVAKDAYIGQSILVTGAGGSIGSALCQKLMSLRPKRLVLFELSEFALYSIQRALSDHPELNSVEIVPVLGSVRDAAHIRHVLRRYHIDIVLHAAAYKHVPLAETNALVVATNNVLGTHVVASEAARFGVGRFMLISSDKAVRPANVMGASKRLAEHAVQYLQDRHPETAFGIVRFGNVAGSSGSVVPLFQDQIRKGGPITITHPGMMRYFMSVDEAVALVLLTGTMACHGNIYVLDMGEPWRIEALARQMVKAAGKSLRTKDTPDGDIEIAISGLRPGEKLMEELSVTRPLLPTDHPKILRARDPRLPALKAASMLRDVQAAANSYDADAMTRALRQWAEGYDARPDDPLRIAQDTS